MSEFVYGLCALISVGCALLLFRSYRRRPVRLLLWVMSSFWLIALNNVMLFVDRVLLATVDLSLLRAAVALIAAMVLLYGLIWESR
ncbi:MAG: DUF5985 family protein [Myxococcaceae bacterium]